MIRHKPLNPGTKRMRPVPGLPYTFASEGGDIYSSHPRSRWRGELHPLKPADNGRGYLRVRCHGKSRCVHRLVAAAFLGPIPAGLEVNHRDGDKGNNRWTNLEYVTRAQNCQHALDTGLREMAGGADHHNAKLTSEAVEAIRSEYWRQAINGRLPRGAAKEIARKFGVHRDYPRLLATARAWKGQGVVG